MKLSDFDREAERANDAARFPGGRYGWRLDLKSDDYETFESALAVDREEAIQRVFTASPYLIQYAVDSSGHHGIWMFPKATIKPPNSSSKGMIPDYLIATRSSLGYFWNIVELKKSTAQFANRAGNGFSPEGNRAVSQCNEYLAHFQNYIETIRTNVGSGRVVQPQGAIILIGDARAESDAQAEFRSAFVRNNPRISVVSYDRVLRGLAYDTGHSTP